MFDFDQPQVVVRPSRVARRPPSRDHCRRARVSDRLPPALLSRRHRAGHGTDELDHPAQYRDVAGGVVTVLTRSVMRGPEVVALSPAAKGRHRNAECAGDRTHRETDLRIPLGIAVALGHRHSLPRSRVGCGRRRGGPDHLPATSPAWVDSCRTNSPARNAHRSDRHPWKVWKSPANPSPPVHVGVGLPVTVTVAPGPATPIESPGRTPVVLTCAPGPTAIVAGPDRYCAAERAVPPVGRDRQRQACRRRIGLRAAVDPVGSGRAPGIAGRRARSADRADCTTAAPGVGQAAVGAAPAAGAPAVTHNTPAPAPSSTPNTRVVVEWTMSVSLAVQPAARPVPFSGR